MSTTLDPSTGGLSSSTPTSVHPSPRRPGGVPVWAWVLIGLGVAGTALMALALVGLNMYLTHDLLDEDFSSGGGEFLTGENTGHTFTVEDGTYVITSRTANAGGAFTFANLARTAYTMTVDADIVSMPVDSDAFVGIACAAAGGTDGYYLVVRGSGPGVALVRIDASRIDDPQVLAVDETADLAPARSMRLECVTPPLGESVDLTGYVDGAMVVTATDAVGIDGFDTVVLHFGTPIAGASAAFDNVRAVVPE